MKKFALSLAALLLSSSLLMAGIGIDEAAFGKRLGGWTKRSKQSAEYPLSGSTYRTYRPEVSPTPDGGLFVSVRIDHVRGWLSSDDHATLEITIDSKGHIASARSNIAIQGRSITSDLIRGTGEGAKQVVGMDRAVQIGTDLVADLSSKLLREKLVEAGRVSFPAAIRHNYNLLYQCIVHTEDAPAPAPAATGASPTPEPTKPEQPSPANAKVKIEPYNGPVVEGLPGEKE